MADERLLILREVTEKYDAGLLKKLLKNGLDLDCEYQLVAVDKNLLEAGKFDWQLVVDTYRPSAICLLGDTLMSTICEKKGITKLRGKAQNVTVLGLSYKVIPTFSEFYVEKVNTALETWASDINKAALIAQGKDSVQNGTKIVMCDTQEKVLELVKHIWATGICCFDFESNKLDEKKYVYSPSFFATVLSISFQAGSSWVIPLEHFDSPFTREEVFQIMAYLDKAVFSNPKIRKVAHNFMFDWHVAYRYGVKKMRGRIDDTMLMHHIVDETQSHKLKDIVRVYFPEFGDYEDEIKQWKWDEIPLENLARYSGTDSDLELRLCTLFEGYLLDDTDSRSYLIYRNLSMAVLRPIFEAEEQGMPIDVDYLFSALEEVDALIARKEAVLRGNRVVRNFEESIRHDAAEEAITALENKIAEYIIKHPKPTKTEANMREKLQKLKSGELSASEPINFRSVPQLENLLYWHPSGFNFYNPGGGTGKDIIEELEGDDSGFVDELLIFRSLEKMRGTYLQGLYDRLDGSNHVHTNLLIHGTVSGRLSSRNPNLQNLPNIAKLKDEDVIRVVGMVKRCFLALEGHTLLAFDFSQIELRVIGSFAKDETMITAYANGEDLHSKTGAVIKNLSLEEFMALPDKEKKEGRTRAKAGNFGLIYGIGIAGFIEYARTNYKVYLTEEEARDIKSKFFKLYPRLLEYHDEYIAKAQKFGYVRTLFGRKRRTPNIEHPDDYIRSMDERVAINSPIQGTAGEFTIFCIALMHHRVDPRVKLAVTVHDSVMMMVPDELVADTARIMKLTAENLPTMQYFKKELVGVTTKIDLESTKKSWKDLEPYTFPQ